MPAPRRLRADLPFRHPAVVLSGGGALGAYQVGVLRVLGGIGLAPRIVLGMSVGAINAVGWIADGLRTGTLERAWARAGPSTIGMRWTSLTLRVAGLIVTVLAALEVVLTAIGSGGPRVAGLFLRHASRSALESTLLDILAWFVVGAGGFLLARLSRGAEDWLSRSPATVQPQRFRVFTGIALGLGLLVHTLTLAFDYPWPHRFSATVLTLGGIVWLVNRPGITAARLRTLLVRLLPDSGGRGLWRGLARRQLIEGLVREGDAARLFDGQVKLIVNAVAVDTGRIAYFLNWPNPSPALRARVTCALGDVYVMQTPDEVIEAASASSSLPVLFQPVRFRGHDLVDAGLFSSHAIEVVTSEGADAVLVVMMSPAGGPVRASDEPHLFEVGARLLDLGNWRDLRTEMLSLPSPWSRDGDPARLCVVEPDDALPGSLLQLDPTNAAELMRRGEADAWAALARARWLEPADAPRPA